MATASNSEVKLKLLIDKRNQKVVFAEAGKDFVDFLFSLMSLPLATVIDLLSTNNMVGSIGNLYDSIESLSTSYLQSNQNKDSILKPKVPILGTDFQNPLLLSNNSNTNTSRKVVYVCCNLGSRSFRDPGHRYVADEPNSRCPGCSNRMSTEVPYVNNNNNNNASSAATSEEVAASSEGGFVKGVVTYMVMDNLEVKPMSTISGITLLTKFNIRDLASLEEKEVAVGLNLGLKLLKDSFQSKNVLTSVFFPNIAGPGPN